jgi:hypothetical protein
MNLTEYLLKTLEKHNIEYKVENDSKKGEIILSIFYQASIKTLSVIFYENQEIDETELTIKFVGLPDNAEKVTIQSSEWDCFVEQMVLPAYKEEALNQSVFDSWTSGRTSNLLIFDHKKETSKMYFIGLDQADNWSFLHQEFVLNSFIRPVCFNEAGVEGSHWGAAQYKTCYSNSFINYEGILHGKEKDKMLFFLSCSYVPNEFGIEKLKAKSDKNFKLTFDKNMPVDLVLAIETLALPFMDITAIMKEITEDTPNALFFTYVLLSYYGSTELLKYLPKIVQTKNQDIIGYLRQEYDGITNEQIKNEFFTMVKQFSS